MLRALYLGGLAAVLLLFGVPTAPAAAADGLSRFEAIVKKLQADGKLPAGALTYKNAKALGDSGFVLEDVVVTPPADKTPGAKAEPVAIKRITVEDFDFDSLDKKTPPNFLKLRAEGIAVSGKPAEGVDLGQLAGLDKLTGDLQIDYRLDREHKTLTFNRLELDLNGLARLEFSMVLDNVNPDAADLDAAMKDATPRTASLVFEDQSLLSKGLPAAAKAQGMDADTLIKLGKAMLDGMRAGASPPTLAVLDGLESYMDDYQHPKGPLRLTINPPAKATAAVLNDTKSADDAVKALGLVVSYAGTRSQGAAAAPAAPAVANAAPTAAVAAAAAKPGCTAGARLFVKQDDAWWSVTVRDTAGDKCVGKIDGGDEDVNFALDKTKPWSIDGPGQALAKCESGTAVVALYKDGGWYPARVTDKPFTEGNCPIKWDDDASEDTLELKKIRQLN